MLELKLSRLCPQPVEAVPLIGDQMAHLELYHAPWKMEFLHEEARFWGCASLVMNVRMDHAEAQQHSARALLVALLALRAQVGQPCEGTERRRRAEVLSSLK